VPSAFIAEVAAAPGSGSVPGSPAESAGLQRWASGRSLCPQMATDLQCHARRTRSLRARSKHAKCRQAALSDRVLDGEPHAEACCDCYLAVYLLCWS